MSRLSFRPRPLDIHKKLPIVKSFKDFEDDETPASTRNSYFHRIVAEADIEVQHVTAKKILSEIPTPQFVVVDTYERDYSRTFNQPNSYLRARGARAEIGEFVEYDLDNEDEDWLEELNKEKKLLSPEMFELIMFKLEVFDHKARERAGIITPTFGSPILALLQFDSAFEALQALPNISVRYGVFQSIYSYWKEKRDRWQKPVLRRLQPPPPVNDTNPYNVFRPREKTHRLHTRRMQRRENNVQSFEKLRQVRRNLDQAKILLDALIKREEKKREVMESEVSLQRIQIKYKDEAELLEDSLAMPGFPSFNGKFCSSEDEFVDSDDIANSRSRGRHLAALAPSFTNSRPVMVSGESIKQDFRHRNGGLGGWLKNLDPLEPVLLFTKPLDPEKMAAVGIIPPTNPSSTGTSPLPTNPSSTGTSPTEKSFNIRGRIGRGGRLIFDRWNPSNHTPIDFGDSLYALPRKRP